MAKAASPATTDDAVALVGDADVEEMIGNADVEWDSFDSAAYFAHNYRRLRLDDARIIQFVADFFQDRGPHKWRARAIDVGSGANLYPALTMLPFAAEVALCERAHSNRDWLEDELRHPHASWKQFWAAMTPGRPDYQAINKPLEVLRSRAEVVKDSIFHLPAGQYDMGTMFFVAESITTRDEEFVKATQSFVNSLVPKAPFAAAFMRDSSGYRVGNRSFPACSVDEDDVARALERVAQDVKIRTVESKDLRAGYCGMIVATGHRRKAK